MAGSAARWRDDQGHLAQDHRYDRPRGATYKAVEYAGETIRALSMDERMDITNMAVEMGAKVGLMPVDETTKAYLAARGITNCPVDASDPDAVFCAEHRFDASALAPQVACPHGVDQVTEAKTVRELIHQAYLGSPLTVAASAATGRITARGHCCKEEDNGHDTIGRLMDAVKSGVDANEALKKRRAAMAASGKPSAPSIRERSEPWRFFRITTSASALWRHF